MARRPSAMRSARARLRVVTVVTLLAFVAAAPPSAAAATVVAPITSKTVASLVSNLATLVGRLEASERRRLPTLSADIARLKTDAARAAANHDERLAALVKSRVQTLSLKLTDLPAVPRQDEFGVRTEPDLGLPGCREADVGQGYCAGEPNGWLSTRSAPFVNIRKHSFLSSGLEYPQGVRVNASFVAERDDTVMAAVFSAEAHVANDVAGPSKRLFVRALLDNAPAAPGDVVFATTTHEGVRQFLFTARVAAGIHTAEIQWKVDGGATAYLRDANLLVRTGRSIPSAKGTLTAQTPASGGNLVKSTASWQDVPGTSLWFWAPPNAVATVTFTAEAFVSNGKAIAARAVIDNAVISPSDVIFARTGFAQSRGYTFGKLGLAQGWHSARVQWLVEQGGTGTMGDRSVAVAAYPSTTNAPSHPFVAAPSGPNYVLPADGLQQLPGMTASVNVSSKGNGEVAVIFSAEVVSTVLTSALLTVDGAFQLESLVNLTDGTIPGQAKSYVLEAKHLTPGAHTLQVWIGGGMGVTQFGDRTIAVMSETGYVPDLAEAPTLTGGRILDVHVGGVEPLIGPHKVLTILFDPYDCTATPSPSCVDEDDLTVAEVTDALYGPGESVNDFFLNNSGGRFSIQNAGVLGWYHATHPASYYWDNAWETCDYNASGFSSGHAARVSEAVQAAKDDINFASFDVDGDGEVTNHELAIIVLVPQDDGDGSSLAQLLASQCPSSTRVSLDNVLLPGWISGWFTSLDDGFETYQYTTGAHELMHQFSLLDDIYVNSGQDHATFPRGLTLMSQNRFTSTHLDPIEKLALGWVTPRLVDDDLQTGLTGVETSNKVLVLPRYNGPAHGEEFYVLENRRNNAGAHKYDDGILDSGIAVWHAISDPTEAAKHPIGVTQAFWDTTAAQTSDVGNGTMGRWGVRLLRHWTALTMAGVAVFPDKDGSGSPDKDDTLWDNTDYTLVSAVCPALFLGEQFAAKNVLAWADCTASGYGVSFLGAPAATMTVKIAKT